MKRSNDTNQGKVDKSLDRGQTLRTPVGKDSSDWSGKATDEVTAKMKMPTNNSHLKVGDD